MDLNEIIETIIGFSPFQYKTILASSFASIIIGYYILLLGFLIVYLKYEWYFSLKLKQYQI